jgi:aspartate aminotransferase
MRESFRSRRELVLTELNKIPGIKSNIPEGAFYVFPDISFFFGKSDGEFMVNNADDLSLYILNKVNVALVTGSAFGDPKCLRISYAASENELRKALKRIEEALLLLR